MAKSGVQLVGDTYWLVKRVPKRFQGVDRRQKVRLSLKTDSRTVAEIKARAAWAELERAWEARLGIRSEEAEERFNAAREIAQQRGFDYMPWREVAALPTGEIVDRVLAIPGTDESPDMAAACALLGAVEPPPSITLSQVLDAYWPLTEDEIRNKSARQVQAWKNPRVKAVEAFRKTVGDLPLADLTRDHFLAFRAALVERVAEGEIRASSANKDLTHLRTVLNKVNELKDLGLDLRLDRLKLKEEEKDERPPFSTGWIRDRILAPGALSGLNDEAADVVRVMANLGCRPSEIVNLTEGRIHLDAEIPFIEIMPEDREVKSRNARRKLPLIGVALEAMQRHPQGFPRYADNANALSALLGKFFEHHGLFETDRHVLYSLRHSFADRMVATDIDLRIRDQCMGHAPKGVKYGQGASLEHLRRVLAPISF